MVHTYGPTWPTLTLIDAEPELPIIVSPTWKDP